MLKSKVTQLYERKQVDVPRKMRKWRVGTDEVEEQLISLSRTHASEYSADKVLEGDSVRLHCEEGSFSGRTVLLFPGLCLPGADEAEQAVCGRTVGECFDTVLNGVPIKLMVVEICRRVPAEVDDDLVKKEQIEGVVTLDDYRCWYREKTEMQNRKQAQKEIGQFILEEMTRKSEYALDQEELEGWKDEVASEEYEEYLEDGEEAELPKEWGKSLTKEEIIEKIKGNLDYAFKTRLVCEALCEEAGISLTWEALREEFEAMFPSEMAEFLSEEELEQSKVAFVENAAVSKTYGLLFEEAAAYLEE